MITLKLKYSCKKEDASVLSEFRREQSSAIRTAFKFFQKGADYQEMISELKGRSYKFIDSWFITSAYMYASGQASAAGNKKVVFGSSRAFSKRSCNEISKSEWKQKRLFNLYIVGEAGGGGGALGGNRKIKLDTHNRTLHFRTKGRHFIPLHIQASPSYINQLHRLQAKAEAKEMPFTVSLNDTHICITFEEFKEEKKVELKKSRTLAIDMNPSSVGFCILEDSRVLDSGKIDFTELNKQSTNKKHHELVQTAIWLVNKAKHYRCHSFTIEDLNVKSKNHNKGKKFNKLVNGWNRRRLTDSIKKHCSIKHIQLISINPAYSSVIGNIQNFNYPDPISASLEIGRRGLEVVKTKRWSYPIPKIDKQLQNLWKKDVVGDFSDWKELTQWLKNSKLTYRVSTDGFHQNVFRISSIKSRIMLEQFLLIN